MRKPTVIGQINKSGLNAPSRLVSPTIIGSVPVHNLKQNLQDEMWGDYPSGKVTPPKPNPTVINFSSKRETEQPVVVPVSNATTIVSSQPKEKVTTSVIPGTIRKNIDLTINELSQMFPAESVENLKYAMKIMSTISLEGLTPARCDKLALQEQEAYSYMVNEYLRLSSSVEIKSCVQHMNRFQVLFKELSETLANQNKPKGWFGSAPRTIKDHLSDSMYEINQLKDSLYTSLTKLKEIFEEINRITEDFKKLVDDLLSFSIVDQYLLTVVKTLDPSYSAIEQHNYSLLKMIAAIQSGDIIRITMQQTVKDLVSTIKDTVLCDLPAWMEQISFLSNQDFTETQCFTLNQTLQSFIKG